MNQHPLLNFFQQLGKQRIDTYHPLPRTLRLILRLNPYSWRPIPNTPLPTRFQQFLQDLGPLGIKFGQALSTRHDLLSPQAITALSQLQDKIPASPFPPIRHAIENAFKKPLEELFSEFDENPLACASLAQVYAATLHGQSVVVKVLRPHIEKQIAKDMKWLQRFGRWIHACIPSLRRSRLFDIIQEIQNTLEQELDLQAEAANAAQLHRNFEGDHTLKVPKMIWPFVQRRVLVLERISGIPIDDMTALNAAGTDLKLLAKRGVEIFFTQVFRDRFFHADMHPGNIFIDATNPHDPIYCSVDFGMMGVLSNEDQRYLAENLLAFFQRDYARVVELHIHSGWVPAHIRRDQFEAAIRQVCEPIFGRPLTDIPFSNVLLQLLKTAKRFEMRTQPQLFLLHKTLFNIEGLGRMLYPELNLWEICAPIIRKWLKRQVGWRGFLHQTKQALPIWLEKAPQIPELIHHLLEKQLITPSTPPPPSKRWPTFVLGLCAGSLFSIFAILAYAQSH